jgi:hypothetical protein
MSVMGHERQGGGKLQVQQCPQCPVSDGRPEKGGLSLRANCGLACSEEAALSAEVVDGANLL